VSTPDLAIIAALAAYLATVGAGLTAVLAYRRQARIAPPPKETAQQQDAAEQAPPIPKIGNAA
jgi:hypothetical protein